MNNHYIPRLLLKPFSVQGKVNVYDLENARFSTSKIKHVFSQQNLFDEELEQLFATKLEGPFGDLLNHKLLHGDIICLERKENLLIRKFFLVNNLRSPYVNGTWEEMIAKTKSEDHPSMRLVTFLKKYSQEWNQISGCLQMSKESYIRNLKKAMEIDSMEELSDSGNRPDVSEALRFFARNMMAPMICFWDSSDSGQEFIFPKLQGISEMDQKGILAKCLILDSLSKRKDLQNMRPDGKKQLDYLLYGSAMFPENYSMYPISPTRMLVKISPFFRVYFPIWPVHDGLETKVLLQKEPFRTHFYYPLRMELFEPCATFHNQVYAYKVKKLNREEVCQLNAAILNMETEQFVFRDYNKIRDSFWYYDHVSRFIQKKRYDFSRLE